MRLVHVTAADGGNSEGSPGESVRSIRDGTGQCGVGGAWRNGFDGNCETFFVRGEGPSRGDLGCRGTLG